MKIKRVLSQNRRDFWADFECEGCGHVENKVSGYDDRNFHDNVIPAMKCKSCGKSRNELGVDGEFTETKYPAWMTV